MTSRSISSINSSSRTPTINSVSNISRSSRPSTQLSSSSSGVGQGQSGFASSTANSVTSSNLSRTSATSGIPMQASDSEVEYVVLPRPGSVISTDRTSSTNGPVGSSCQTSTRNSSSGGGLVDALEAQFVIPPVPTSITSSDRTPSRKGAVYSQTEYQTSASEYSEAAHLGNPYGPNCSAYNRYQNDQNVPGDTYRASSHSPRPTSPRGNQYSVDRHPPESSLRQTPSYTNGLGDRQQEQYTGDVGLYNAVHKWRTDISEHPGVTSSNDRHAYSEHYPIPQSRQHRVKDPWEDVYGDQFDGAPSPESSRPASSRRHSRQSRHPATFGRSENYTANARQRSSQDRGYRSYAGSSHSWGSLHSHRSRRSSGSAGSFWQKFENFVRFWSGVDPYWGTHRGDSRYSASNRVRSPPVRYTQNRSPTPSMRDRSRENAQIIPQDRLQIPHGSARRPPRQASTLPSIRIAYEDPHARDLNPRPSRYASPRPTVYTGRESHRSSERSQSYSEWQAPIQRDMHAPPATSGPTYSQPIMASGHLHNHSSHRSEQSDRTNQARRVFTYVSRKNTAPLDICKSCYLHNRWRGIRMHEIGRAGDSPAA